MSPLAILISKNNIAAIVSVSLGAIAIEKHFTLSRDLPGIDQHL